jgi:hypothetical protein
VGGQLDITAVDFEVAFNPDALALSQSSGVDAETLAPPGTHAHTRLLAILTREEEEWEWG